jgi:hypothetical protein
LKKMKSSKKIMTAVRAKLAKFSLVNPLLPWNPDSD